MASPNIEKFDALVVRVLGDLYEQFPVPTKIHANAYMDNVSTDGAALGSEVLSEGGRFLNHTLNWLQDSGYVRFKELNHAPPGGANQVVLTAKALEALRAMPSSLEGQTTLGERMKEQAGATASEGASQLVGVLVREGLKVVGIGL